MNLRIDKSARLYGNFQLGDGVYIAQGSILRSINDSISLGNSSWVLENSVLIGSEDAPISVGSKTVFGHKCLVVGAKIGNLCEIGNGVIFMPNSQVGDMCIFGEGSLIPENTIIPSGSVVVGRPGKIIRKLSEEDRAMILRMRSNNIDLKEFVANILKNDMEDDKMGSLYDFEGKYPKLSDTCKIYDSAEITGDVIIGDNSIIGAGVKIIGNSHGPVKIGANVHILENSVLHLLPDNQLIIEDDVTIGPGCIIHGSHIASNSIIESGSIVCDYSRLGENTLVKSGSLVKQRSIFHANKVLEGFPAKEVGENKLRQKRPSWSLR